MPLPTPLVRFVRGGLAAAFVALAAGAQVVSHPVTVAAVPEVDGDLTRTALTLLFFGALLLVRPNAEIGEDTSA